VKQKILKLRNEGKTYNEIKKILGCSKGTIAYHCGKNVRQKQHKRQTQLRTLNVKSLKNWFGGKCQNCNYGRCSEALCFHHIDKTKKVDSVSNIVRRKGIEKVLKETKKCLLLCHNCHSEVHAGMLDLNHLKPNTPIFS
jgi:hypothetical protein